MTRKSTAKCTKIEPRNVYIYEVSYLVKEDIKRDHIEATMVSREDDELVLWHEGADNEDDLMIAAYKNWVSFRICKPNEGLG